MLLTIHIARQNLGGREMKGKWKVIRNLSKRNDGIKERFHQEKE